MTFSNIHLITPSDAAATGIMSFNCHVLPEEILPGRHNLAHHDCAHLRENSK